MSQAMWPPPPRVVRLVLVTRSGDLLGALPSFRVTTPWWQQAQPMIEAAHEMHGVDVTVLRLLETERPAIPDGTVSYLAELAPGTSPPAALEPWPGQLDDHPLRMPWARPGGPAAEVEWARQALAERGLILTRAEQMGTWNLAGVWRMETAEGRAFWLKSVPPFFAHEGRLLEQLQGAPVPVLIAHDDRRSLMAEVRGRDLRGEPLPRHLAMVDLLVVLQLQWIGRVEELLALGLPDWRVESLAVGIRRLVERVGRTLPPADREALDAFVLDLDDRFRRIAETGLAPTLVHGDFHPGNVRGDDDTMVLLDWGDSGVGHPLLDEPAFIGGIPPEHAAPVREHWHAAWRAAVPGSDPETAAELLAPVAAARQAFIYRTFLDNIEPSEHAYHANDPADWLTRTARLLQAEAQTPEARTPNG